MQIRQSVTKTAMEHVTEMHWQQQRDALASDGVA